MIRFFYNSEVSAFGARPYAATRCPHLRVVPPPPPRGGGQLEKVHGNCLDGCRLGTMFAFNNVKFHAPTMLENQRAPTTVQPYRRVRRQCFRPVFGLSWGPGRNPISFVIQKRSRQLWGNTRPALLHTSTKRMGFLSMRVWPASGRMPGHRPTPGVVKHRVFVYACFVRSLKNRMVDRTRSTGDPIGGQPPPNL